MKRETKKRKSERVTTYNPQKIEKKWQKFWEEKDFYKVEDFSKKPKMYVLIEFPYPSGEGLHVGHCRSYSAMDAVARKKRMEGCNVLFPIGFDAFGLPTENYAIKTGIHPQVATEKNIANFKEQLKSLGFSFDWGREIITCDPKYYKWTQWIFLQLFKEGLAYQAKIPVNWCPSCKIGLANEEVIEGKCERCGAKVEKKVLKQWMLKITKYADRLIDNLEKVDYLKKIKTQQIDWIGRSYGAEIKFPITTNDRRQATSIRIFTTRADTLFGATYLVLAPEHPVIKNLRSQISNPKEIEKYIENSERKTERERISEVKGKTGIEVKGVEAINPANNKRIPIFVADYVLPHYGTGAIMAVPAHDERDFEFAKKYKLPIIKVIRPPEVLAHPSQRSAGILGKPEVDLESECWTGEGTLMNSGKFDGMESEKAQGEITKWLSIKRAAKEAISYKLRDWVFSRQHYWGEPIPIIHCKKCGAVPVPEEDLPVKLPYVEKYQPSKTGKSPLANISEWVDVKCPICKGPAKRETDTMPNWAGSNWYYMRYCDPKNDKAIASQKKLKYWLPVDWYNGGMEHTNLHLLYSRFIYKFLFDIGAAPTIEPYKKRTSQGIVLAEDGRKMSKSFGNIINPDDIVKNYGADTLRIYEMFMGPFDQAIAWSTQGVKGVFRFLNKVWELVLACKDNNKSSKEAIARVHKLNKKVDEDLEKMKFNTAVAAFMEFLNFAFESKKDVGKDVIEKFLILLAPFTPHITEELWHRIATSNEQRVTSIFEERWPKYDSKLVKEEMITLVVQVNGKVRDKIEVKADISEEKAKELVLSREKIKKWTKDKEIKKVIFVPGKLMNIVV